MASQTILWIGLPHGFTPAPDMSRARLSVFVAPRLQPDADGKLAPFDFLDWPSHLESGKVEFEVAFGQTKVKALLVSRPDSRLWKALFDRDTFVRPHTPGAVSPVFASYPTAGLHDRLKAGYQEVCANSPLDRAPEQVFTAAFAELHEMFGPPLPAGSTTALAVDAGTERANLAKELFRTRPETDRTAIAEALVDSAKRELVEEPLPGGRRPERVAIVPDRGDSTNQFAQFKVFHEQPVGKNSARTRTASDEQLDFHQLVTALGEYPDILRLLGLLIELELDAPDVPEAALAGPGTLRIIATFRTPLGLATRFLTPATAYVCERGKVFSPAPELPSTPAGATPVAGEMVSGLLNLRLPMPAAADQPQFRIIQVDVDGAGLRTIDLLGKATSAGATPDIVPLDRPKDFALPPLRSSGFSIARHGHAELLLGTLDSGLNNVARLAAGEDVILFADDLLRGYRVDVHEARSDQWRSLHKRDGTYKFLRIGEVRQVSDEGCVQPALVQPIDRQGAAPSTHDPSVPSYVSETLFQWDGWSLAASRPGTLSPTPSIEASSPGLNLETAFAPPRGSLPRLRFGEGYRMRVRTVDLAGNGLSLEEANDVLARLKPAETPVLPGPIEDLPYLRFEPIASPVVIARSNLQDGETAERIILRSNHDVTADAFVAAHPKYLNANERHIAPPKTWQLMAEMTGLFDTAIGGGQDLERMHQLATREKGVLNGMHPEPSLTLPYLPDPFVAGVAFRGLPSMGFGKVGRVVNGQLQFTDMPLPSDKVSKVGSLVLIEFGPAPAWPDLQPFRLRLAEGLAGPKWDPATRVLTVFLGKGESANVRIACYLRGDAELRQLGIWKWMVEWLDAQRKLGKITDAERATRFEEFRQLSLLGLWWLLTPYRELTLLHALQQPLEAPKFVSFRSPFRFAGDTSVHIPATARVHPQTTGRLELVARWTDKVDDDPARPPRDVAHEASLFPTQLSLDRNAPAVTTGPPMVKVNIADRTVEYLTPDLVALEAKIREVSAKLSESIDAFRIAAGSNQRLKDMASGARDEAAALFPLLSRPPWLELPSAARAIASLRSGLDLAGELHDPIGPLPPGIRTAANNVDSAAEALAVAAEAATAKLATAPVRHEFSDTRHRRVAYQALATARFPECFSGNAPDEAVPITRLGETNNAVILSSVRPPPPVVQYVVPLFGWSTQTSAPPQVRRRRRSGGLRVYLERPWFSSGEGEVLGVVLGDNLSAADLEKFAPFVTQWGRDPLWHTASTTNMPVPTSFTGLFDLSTNVVPADAQAPPRVAVVQLAVEFDKDGRCFCDIMMDPAGSYWPFVRLALARFQRNSIQGLEMSRIVLADFAQIAPDRTVTVTKNATDVFGVVVNGLTHESALFPIPISPASQKGTRMRVSAQQRIPGAADDAGWLPAGPNASVAVEVDKPNGDLLWKGAVTLPTARKPGQFRILVEELEKHRSLNPDKSSPEFPLVDRVVFAETVEI